MHRVHAGSLAGVLALLAVTDATAGLGTPGWAVGAGCGAAVGLLLGRALARRARVEGTPAVLGPANRVTLLRAVLVCGVAALAADSGATSLIVALAAVVIVLDGVDGRIARRTGTVSALGARFDMEVDAFLILVLSLYVAGSVGWWVLLIGVAHYALVLARQLLPWLRRPLPPRPWCKVVAVVQGVVLTVVAADVLPSAWAGLALLVALVLLAESFGREVRDLWRLHASAAAVGRTRLRVVGSTMATVLAGAVVWLALVLPNRTDDLSWGAVARIPLEGLVLVLLALLLGPRARRLTAALFGVLLGALLVIKFLDMGFYTFFDRPFNLLNDWYYFGPGVGVLGDSIGHSRAVAVATGAAVLAVVVLVGLCLAVVRLTGTAVAHRRTSARTVTALGIAWAAFALAGVHVASDASVASTSAADLAYDQVHQLREDLADRGVFAREIAVDPFDTPAGPPLDGLRGKDVLLVFVESYGRVALEGSTFAPGVNAVLEDGTQRLRASGYSSRSGFLTSPTFGAASWLAHASLQSGLWVNSQQRYDQLLTRQRLTLAQAFGRAGWRTVFDMPANTHDWPEGGRFYGFDQLYDSRNVGYEGPKFGYASMPDQYTLATLARTELTADRGREPVMAQVDLISSHHPWTPLPRLVDWADVGDGSVFDGMPAEGESKSVVFRDPDKVRELYGRSIEYTMSTLVSWLETKPARDLVVIVVGDHQPHSYVSGDDPGRDVPVTIIAEDPAVTARIADWGWQDGLRPAPDAPVLRMDRFRDRFLTAFAGS